MSMHAAESIAPRAFRPGTEAFHRQIVERAVLAIQTRFSEEDFRLATMASAAISSPFHFARLFRRIAGVPPGHFLTAVRMQEAKRLLAQTRMSVTDVCFEVGYTSLGTFTRRFTELVGASPRRYRRLAQADRRSMPVRSLAPAPPHQHAAMVYGEIVGPGADAVAIGLFPTALPQGQPAACAIVAAPGPYRIAPVPEGRYFALAVALAPGIGVAQDPELRGAAADAIVVPAAPATVRVDIALRRRQLTDPPIVVSIPLLMAEAAARLPTSHRSLELVRDGLDEDDARFYEEDVHAPSEACELAGAGAAP